MDVVGAYFRRLAQNVIEKKQGVNMPNAVIEDWNGFAAFLAAQPLCAWSAQKQEKIAAGLLDTARSGVHLDAPGKKKDDNADLMAALSSMA